MEQDLIRSTVLVAIWSVALGSSNAGPTPQPTPSCAAKTGAHRAGDRIGIHGMVVFGRRGGYFLEHIPMFSPPHDEQLVMRVSLHNAAGAPLTADFSHQGYSLRPATTFSPDDLVLRKLPSFVGDIHRGNFEANGPVIHSNVTVAIDEVLVARRLPAADRSVPAYYMVGDRGPHTRRTRSATRAGSSRSYGSARSRVRCRHCALALTEVKARDLVGAAGTATLWCLRAPAFVRPRIDIVRLTPRGMWG